MAPQTETISMRCCVAGGGPAGMMLGFLLARAGVDVLVLEKHADFLRDFRGDTIHPSTLELMYELRLLEEFLQRPHDEERQLNGWIGESLLRLGDFTHLPTHCKFIAFMPQWGPANPGKSSTAARTGSAPSSLPRAAMRSFAPAACPPFARILPSWLPFCATVWKRSPIGSRLSCSRW